MQGVVDATQVWRTAFEHSPIGMALVSPAGDWLAVNEALCDMFGYTREQLAQMSFQEITHPDDLEMDLDLLHQCLEGKISSYRLRKRYRRGDGEHVWGDLSVSLVRDEEDEPQYFISQVLDVTVQRADRERLADALAEVRHHRLVAEAVFASVDVGLVQIDKDGRYVRMNKAHRRYMELAFPDGHAGVAGQLGEIYHADSLTPFVTEEMPTSRAARGEEFDDLRMWVGADPSTRRALSVSSRCVRDHHGKFTAASLAYKDITDLLRASEVKDEFVAAVSHELRTPLTSVMGHLELLMDDPEVTGDARDSLVVVERNARRLKTLVSDLLQVAAEARGEVALTFASVDLAQLVRESISTGWVEQQGIGIDLDLPDSLEIVADPDRIGQVVDNLVSNALKYSPEGGRIGVTLRPTDDGGAELVVSDEGMGIDEDDREQLFTRFYRSPRVRQLQIAGTGLGLSIARSIVEGHGGEISFESTPDQGSTFRVILPGPDAAV